MMREILAGFILGLLLVAVLSPETVGEWLKKVDEVRYVETMYE